MLWQYRHDFITFTFHLTERSGTGFAITNIMEFLGSLIALCGALAFGNIFWAVLKERREKDLFYNSIVFIGIIFLLSFRNKIEANWIVTASTVLIPLICIHYERRRQTLIKNLLAPMFFIVLALRYLLILPEGQLESYNIDRIHEVKSWKRISREVKKIANGQKLYADTYQVAAKLSFYLKRPIHALHIRGRSSQYSLEPVSVDKNQKMTYVAIKKRKGAIIIKTGYKDDLYIYKDKTLPEIKRILNR
jgi:hypothetical protein